MLGQLKHTVRNYLARRLELPEVPVSLRRLAGQGFKPNLVFDVGAYRGDFTRLCLELWPETRVACFEVQQRILPQLEQLASGAAGVSVFPTLLGSAQRDAVELYEAETASSVLIETAGPRHPSNMYRMTTVDAVVAAAFGGHPPNLLKIDVQGYELEVLKGAAATLPGVDVILAEINLLDIHTQVPLLADVVRWLDDRRFVAFDICALTRRPLDRALWQCDMLFVPAGSALRQDKRWGIESA